MSCIDVVLLQEMADAYNKDNFNNKIKTDNNMLVAQPLKYKNYLIKQFEQKLNDKCDTQLCWTKQNFIKHMKDRYKEELQKYTFRPNGPKGKNEWLSTTHIDDVMLQYEKKFNDFKYLGTVPMDFDNLPELGIKDLNLAQLIKNGIKQIAVIFNLDKSHQSGSHWVALYANLHNGHIYFSDSYGVLPYPEVRKLIKRIALFLKNNLGFKIHCPDKSFCKNKIDISPQSDIDSINKSLSGSGNLKRLTIDYNKTRFQYDGSECGVYSINFIERLLNGETFQNIVSSKMPYEVINKYRNKYFSNTKT